MHSILLRALPWLAAWVVIAGRGLIAAEAGTVAPETASPAGEPVQPTWEQLMNGSLESQYVEVRGLVGGLQNRNDGWTVVILHTVRGDLKTIVLRSALTTGVLEQNERALVRLRGHLLVDRDPKTERVISGQVRFRDPELIVERPPPADVWALPLRTAAALTQASADYDPFRWVKVSGQIIHVRSRMFFLMDQGTGLRFVTDNFPDLKAGDVVEVAGYQDILNAAAPVLRGAVVRKVGVAPLPVPRRLSNAELVSPSFDSTWVQVEGVLAEIKPNEKEQVLEIRAGGLRFWSRLAVQNGSLPPLRTGSRIELTGAYCAQGEYRVLGPDVAALDLLLNSPSGIKVLSTPPWWTWKHTVAVMSALLLVLVGASVWISQLRRRVAERTQALHETMARLEDETKRSATLAERNRIASEIHDGLEQGLNGIMMQLDGVESQLAASPAAARRHLELARKMVGFSRTEVRHSLWDWKSPALTHQDLPTALTTIVTQMASESGAQVAVQVAGEPCPLPPAAEHQLLRICQEALTNAMKHARARRIEVRLDYGADAVQLAVCDDGRGFVPEDVLDGNDGHLGLQNLRDRARKLGGKLVVNSALQQGATVTVHVSYEQANQQMDPGKPVAHKP